MKAESRKRKLGARHAGAAPVAASDVEQAPEAADTSGMAPEGGQAGVVASPPTEAGPEHEQDARPTKAPRLVSLDAFRGLTIVGMLLVNNAALDTATPRHLTHAGWGEGLTFADMVFPWFLLIVGVAIPFSYASHKRKGLRTWQWDLKVLGRAASLVFLGCLIESTIAKTPYFSLGVLQLIGCAYFVAALLCDLPPSRKAVVAAGLLGLHWAILKYLPVPGVGTGVISESQNAIQHLNETYLQPYHLEGLPSVIPTAALVLLGSMIGDALRAESGPMQGAAVTLASGLGMAVLGLLWNASVPFSKPLWTGSYILYTGGVGTLVLGVLFLVMDAQGLKWLAFPLLPFGMNPLTAYVVPILTKLLIFREWTWKMPDGSHLQLQQAIWHWCFVHWGRVPGGWVYTVGYLVVWWLILLEMYRRKIFWRV